MKIARDSYQVVLENNETKDLMDLTKDELKEQLAKAIDVLQNVDGYAMCVRDTIKSWEQGK